MTEEKKERKKQINGIEREILKELLSIMTLQFIVRDQEKLSRTEALERIMLEFFSSKKEVIDQILTVARLRKLKTKEE